MFLRKLQNATWVICFLLIISAFAPICSATPFSQMTPEQREQWMDREQEQMERDYAAAQRQIAEGRRQQARMQADFSKSVHDLAFIGMGAWILKGLAVLAGLGFLRKIANRKPERIIIREPVYQPRPNNQLKKQKSKNNAQLQKQKQNNASNSVSKKNAQNNASVQPQQAENPPAKKKRRRKKKKATNPMPIE